MVQELPIFGFRSRVTLVDMQPCALDVECDSEGNSLVDVIGEGQEVAMGASPFAAEERQTGEEFQSEGPPECRTELNPLGCL